MRYLALLAEQGRPGHGRTTAETFMRHPEQSGFVVAVTMNIGISRKVRAARWYFRCPLITCESICLLPKVLLVQTHSAFDPSMPGS